MNTTNFISELAAYLRLLDKNQGSPEFLDAMKVVHQLRSSTGESEPKDDSFTSRFPDNRGSDGAPTARGRRLVDWTIRNGQGFILDWGTEDAMRAKIAEMHVEPPDVPCAELASEES